MGKITSYIPLPLLAWVLTAVPASTAAGTPFAADTVQVRVEREIEQMMDEPGAEPSGGHIEETIDRLHELAGQPLNINRASAEELLQVPGLTLRLAQAIVEYREREQPFEETRELLQVRGIGPVTYDRIHPYLTVGSAADQRQDLYTNPLFWTNNSRFEGFSRLQRVLEPQEGYLRADTLGGYTGSPVKYYQRFRYQSNRISVNLTQEKDPGEPLSGPVSFDFNSWHMALNNLGRLKMVVAGDYSLRFGQGLILWNGASFGKGRSVIQNSRRNEQGIRPYTSAQETDFFRGGAATWGDGVQLTVFHSSRNRTASVVSGDTIRYPSDNGLHRTLLERNRRFNTRQVTFGGRVRMALPGGYAGVTGYVNRFDRPVYRGVQPWQRYLFEGRKTSAISADYRLVAGPLLLFGEAGRSRNGGYGLVTGMELDAGEETDLVLSYRNYGRSFQSIFGSAFGEQSGNPQNEEGFYIGIRQTVSGSLQISGFMDRFRFPAPRHLTHHPSGGYDWLILAEYTPSRRTELYLQVRQKIRGEEFSTTDEFGRAERLPDESRRLNGRLHLTRQIHPQFRSRSRAEFVRARPVMRSPEYGYLIYQDVQYRPHRAINIEARLTWFHTDGFDSRVYQFENDLLYVLSNSMLFGRGWRKYLLVSWEPSERVRFWLKVSSTLYPDRETIGSGLTRIDGNRRRDIGIQARVRF